MNRVNKLSSTLGTWRDIGNHPFFDRIWFHDWSLLSQLPFTVMSHGVYWNWSKISFPYLVPLLVRCISVTSQSMGILLLVISVLVLTAYGSIDSQIADVQCYDLIWHLQVSYCTLIVFKYLFTHFDSNMFFQLFSLGLDSCDHGTKR